MSFVDKIKDAFGNDKAQQTADAVAEAGQKAQAEQAAREARDAAEAREAADRDAEQQRDASVEAERMAAQAIEDQRQADEQRRAGEALAAQTTNMSDKPRLSINRVREVVAHDSNPNTPTGEGMDKELGMLLETALRRALDQAGLPNRNTDDGSLGTMFLESYSRWQGHLGYSGSDADGMPGRDSLAKLADATGMFDVID
ncbi:MAG: hypothetical protein Q4F67_16040 [Propionibacteriaceae bacterium]|nr:hypothetical protein [Propionibacteriaceae bacterium]